MNAATTQADVDATWDRVSKARNEVSNALSAVERFALRGTGAQRIEAETDYANAARSYARALNLYADTMRAQRSAV